MSEEIELRDRPGSMTGRLSAEAALIGGGEPKHDGFVMREDACAVSGQLLGPVALEGEATRLAGRAPDGVGVG